MFAEAIKADNSAAVELNIEQLRENLMKRLETSMELSPDLGLWFTNDITRLPR